MAKVTIYTQVYNAGPYLRPCLDSVLAQTHTDWEHIIADAGSTDGSVEILKEYAAGDSRVKFIQLPENRWSQYEMTEQYATGEFYASLDHDDWWEPEFLERLLTMIREHDLDIAFTGVSQYYQKQQIGRVLRRLASPVFLSIKQFAQNYEKYGKFANARWASIMGTKKYLSMKDQYDESLRLGLTWRSDTVLMLKYLENMERIGIDNSVLQHYRNHTGSQIQQIDHGRLRSEEEYYRAVQAFLEKFGAWGPKQQDWAKGMYLIEAMDSLQKLEDYGATDDEKLQGCSLFLGHPLTRNALTYRADPSRVGMFLSEVKRIVVSTAGESLSGEAVEAFSKAIQSFAPECAGAAVPAQFAVFAKEPGLVDLMLKGGRDALQDVLLDLIDSGKYEKEFDLAQMVPGIIPEGNPLYGIQDVNMFKLYPQLCRFILGGANLTALDLMTGLLLEGGVHESEMAFLQTYLNLSAQMGQVPAFLFGKIRLAEHYLQSGQPQLCMETLEELKEMGAGEHEEVLQLEAQLHGTSKGALI